MKNCLIISSGQPCGNPRMVKEAISLSKSSWNVTVIYCPLSTWGDFFDQKLFSQNPQISWIRAGAHPNESKLVFFIIRMRRKFWGYFFDMFGNYFNSALKSSCLYSQELEKEAIKHKADIYIGHNLGSIRAVLKASKKFNSKSCFDFEDFHRAEHPRNSIEYELIKKIEDKYVRNLDITYSASPLISEQYQKIYPALNMETINNCFPLSYRPKELLEISGPLKLFWFSQYIGENRGIEQIISAMGILKKNYSIELSLLGKIENKGKEYFRSKFISNGLDVGKLHFLDSVEENEIVEIAAKHHVGLAVEVPHVLNRDICLTNKLFMYLLAGNAILYSNTSAQKDFFEKHKQTGQIFKSGDCDEIADKLKKYCDDRMLLESNRQFSFNLAEVLNWDVESRKLINIINGN